MGKVTISTTVDIELHATAKEKGISWSEALAYGIIKLSNIYWDLESDAKLTTESAKCKIMKLQSVNSTMQDLILELSEKLEDKNVLEKRKRKRR